ncbi:ABC transporter ATP-binding protein [Amnibacterium endophyticum]|uniref:ABC transporter ATP-binding protein n=1 Tax=Amnibacterium endophyticum TaxID=2109337 RepID=A0ABW4L9Z4_9MICO
MPTPVISVEDVGIQFKINRRRQRSLKDLFGTKQRREAPEEFWAFRNVSFDVQQGESIGVVGRNGQGKSTLLKIVAEVIIPDEGTVEVRRGVAPLIEITGGFVDDLSVRDNVYLAAGLHGKSREQIDDEFADIIEFAEIKDFVNTPYKHLSSGMKVRVAFSVVSRLDEPILLVDEVLAVGDRGFRRKCYARIEEMLADGRTLFFVSHNDGDLKRFCNRGLYLDDHVLKFDGPIEDAYERYTADYS